ncbi:MAG TPA: potassium transporter TrkG [Candidatus Saccharimonadales bacterium]|nr:potassium transporter TrkG [Candidatus Saccharimonadales bacterium]
MIATKGRYFLKYYPQHMILLSLIISIGLGTLLLGLPISRTQYIPLIDLFFTSASLTTVTGLMTVPINHFTHFGHGIMLCLMQLGGIGLMTLSLVFIYKFSNLGIYTQVIASEVLSLKSFKDTKYILFFIIKLTILTEFLGAILIFPTMYQIYPLNKAIFLSIFHSVSSFCNAGFSLFPDGMMQYSHNPLMIFTTMLLMIIGGLGFVTWHELSKKFLYRKSMPLGMSWHTKIVLRMYLFTSIMFSVLFWLIERNHSLAAMPFFQKLYVVLFTGIAMKSTGFAIISFTTLQMATLVLCMVSMFIGSAPLSTGSGIKTSVFAIYLAVIKAAIQGKRQALLYGRQIVDDQVYKAMAILVLSLSWIVIITFGLLITEPNWQFIDILFGTVAAFCNNGTFIRAAELLTTLGKCFIILSMIIGRIGALALILSMKRISEQREISYPKEHVILG